MNGYIKRSFNIEPETMRILERYADAHYMDVSNLVRLILDKWAGKIRYDLPEVEDVYIPPVV